MPKYMRCRRFGLAREAKGNPLGHKSLPRDIQFFQMVLQNASSNIMGLKGVHSPEALHQKGSCFFCPWCGKEGQKEGTIMNHLRTMDYHLGLVRALCVDFFLMSMDAMRQHAHVCKSITATENNDHEGGV